MKTTKFLSIISLFVICTLISSCNGGNILENATTNISKVDTSKKTFKKTKYSCGTCSCSGYWGYQHSNGTWEGACQNRDKWGHTCNHSPKAHGLRSW